jgi:hypothetical protein
MFEVYETQWKLLSCKILCKNVNGKTINLNDYELIDDAILKIHHGKLINSFFHKKQIFVAKKTTLHCFQKLCKFLQFSKLIFPDYAKFGVSN